MKGSRIARRYARALLDLADKGNEETWGVELDRLAAMVESPELIERLSSPELSEQSRQEAMAKIAERLDLSFPLRSFAVVVARHRRVREIGAIAESYRELLDQRMGRERATLTFALQPSDAEVARVVGGLEAIVKLKIIPTVKVDAALLGGVTAALGGKIYDGSLATRLAEAKRRLAG
jgi:F-type H+-transporting ATPase subunit delta